MEKTTEIIILSRYFDENVLYVAGVCSKCQREHDDDDDDDDVRITAVNRRFVREAEKRKRRRLWSPPRSPHNLIEESLYRNPWSLLVATIFLNKTSCMAARMYVEDFLETHPTPESVLEKRPGDLEPYFESLGLKKRAEQVWRMSYDFVHKNWKDATELYGIGGYGRDAYRIFCLGDFDFQPADRFLRIYRAWFQMQMKQDERPTNFKHLF